MSARRQLFIASYDIACPQRLRAALRLARRHASGGQKSVHECWMDERERVCLLSSYAAILDPDRDRVLLAGVDPLRSAMSRGVGSLPSDPDVLLVH